MALSLFLNLFISIYIIHIYINKFNQITRHNRCSVPECKSAVVRMHIHLHMISFMFSFFYIFIFFSFPIVVSHKNHFTWSTGPFIFLLSIRLDPFVQTTMLFVTRQFFFPFFYSFLSDNLFECMMHYYYWIFPFFL